MMPPGSAARLSASADLPLAVGPAIRTACLIRPSFARSSVLLMPLIATLVSHPTARVLTPQIADSARAAVGARALDWLAARIPRAVVLPAGTDAPAAAAVLADHLALVPVDVAVQHSGNRR